MTMCGSTWKTPPRAANCNHVNRLTAITGGSRPDPPRSATTVASLQERHGWPGLATFGKSEASGERPTRTNTETGYQIISARVSPEHFQHAVRSRRAIKDCLHRVLDVTMNRDQQQNRKGSGPENLAMMQRFALDLARLEPTKDSMRGKLNCASWNDDFLPKIIRAAKPRTQKR